MQAHTRVAVFGAGANGGAIAASLFQAGTDVTAIDPWPAHVEAVRSQGLLVRTRDEEQRTHVPFLHVCELAELREKFDLIILGVKAYDTRWACEAIKPYLNDAGTVVAVQNGLTLDAVSEIIGVDRSVACVIEVAANMFTPGEIVQQAPMWLALGGETPESQSRASEVASILSHAAVTVVVDDIRSAKWMKLVANACELVPSAILDLPLAEAIAQPGMYDFMLEAGREALEAALSAGQRIVPIFDREVEPVQLDPDTYVQYLLDAVLAEYTFSDTLTTVLQDWRKGRKAEIGEINGEVVAVLGETQAPSNARVLRLAFEIESGTSEAGVHNLELLLSQ